MLDRPRIGWRFSSSDVNRAEPPISEATSVIDLLISFQTRLAESSARQIAEQHRHVSVAYLVYARRMIEVLGSQVMGRVVGPSSPGQTSEVERAMVSSVRFKEIDDLVEGNLNRILANPELAEEAFPDPQLRENIIPLFRGIRELAEEREKEVSKR